MQKIYHRQQKAIGIHSAQKMNTPSDQSPRAWLGLWLALPSIMALSIAWIRKKQLERINENDKVYSSI